MRNIILITLLCLWSLPELTFAQSINLANEGDWVNIGDLDISGNQITVEALIYLSTEEELATNIVSKHYDQYTVNYLLRPMTFELTTYISGNSGPTQFLRMYNPYKLSANKWYHIAGTYDGTHVKFYVDGCLVSQKDFTGNLCQNDLLTAIGNQSYSRHEQFLGMIDEVRLWKVCRTQSQIADNMLTITNPASQSGLLAYYKFDGNLKNQMGNAVWDGVPVGNPTFISSNVNIQAFKIIELSSTNTSCSKSKDGTVTVTTNRPNASYSTDSINFTSSPVLTNINPGKITVYAQSQEGCVVDSTINIGNNNYSIPVSYIASICQGDSYFGYSKSGTYTDVIASTAGCDSIRTINLTVKQASASTINAIVCSSDLPYKWNGNNYTAAGSYPIHLTNAVGCDSTVTLNLKVNPAKDVSLSASICQGETYTLNNIGYTTSGSFNQKFVTTEGCDSTVTVHLTVFPTYSIDQNIRLFAGESYSINNHIYTESGTYSDSLKTINGCDSVIHSFVSVTTIPNAFTPNDDGKNDRFMEGWQIKIYNRDGDLLFEGSDGWDGKYKGKQVAKDTYFYILTYPTLEGTKSRVGYVMAIY